MSKWIGAFIVPPMMLLLAGCGASRYPVTGKVTYEDGTPVDGGTVIGEAEIDGVYYGVQGNIGKDGTYQLGADKPGQGAIPGTYNIQIVPIPVGDNERSEGKRPAFEKLETTLEVKSEKNQKDFIVARHKGS